MRQTVATNRRGGGQGWNGDVVGQNASAVFACVNAFDLGRSDERALISECMGGTRSRLRIRNCKHIM